MPPTYVYNPTGFDPTAALPRELGKYGDFARYFLHSIIMREQVRGRADADGFVPIRAELIRPYFPGNDHYTEVRECLISGGSIECDGNYVKGHKAMGYRLGEDLRKMRRQRVEVTNRSLIKKIQVRRDEWVNAPGPVHRHLLRNLREVEIDYPVALEALLAGEHDPSDETGV